MKKIIVSVLALILIIGIIISINLFVKNQQIQESLKDVAESEFVTESDVEAVDFGTATSKVLLVRKDGEWSTTATGEYSVDPESIDFTFTGYKIGGEHTGTFEDIEAEVSLTAEGSPVDLTINIKPQSVKTDSEAVDKHLQDSVFFDTQNYDTVTIAIKGFETPGYSVVHAITDITIKGITKTLKIPFELVNRSDSESMFVVDTKIKISEWNMAFGPVLDDVRVMLKGAIVKN